MLRASNDEAGIDQPEHAAELEAFATAVASGSEEVGLHREALRAALHGGGRGDELLAEAAAVTAAFHGYVRVADGTGIPVDELVVATSGDLRDELGINAYAGRENSTLDVDARPATDFNPHLDPHLNA